MSKIEQLVEDLSGLTVLEAAELAKLLEDKWGVSAAAPVAAVPGAGAGGGGRGGRASGGGCCSCCGKDRVHGRPGRGRRQEDQCHQGSPRDHRTWPKGSKGPRRGRSQGGQGRCQQGRSGEDQKATRRRWRES